MSEDFTYDGLMSEGISALYKLLKILECVEADQHHEVKNITDHLRNILTLIVSEGMLELIHHILNTKEDNIHIPGFENLVGFLKVASLKCVSVLTVANKLLDHGLINC